MDDKPEEVEKNENIDKLLRLSGSEWWVFEKEVRNEESKTELIQEEETACVKNYREINPSFEHRMDKIIANLRYCQTQP